MFREASRGEVFGQGVVASRGIEDHLTAGDGREWDRQRLVAVRERAAGRGRLELLDCIGDRESRAVAAGSEVVDDPGGVRDDEVTGAIEGGGQGRGYELSNLIDGIR